MLNLYNVRRVIRALRYGCELIDKYDAHMGGLHKASVGGEVIADLSGYCMAVLAPDKAKEFLMWQTAEGVRPWYGLWPITVMQLELGLKVDQSLTLGDHMGPQETRYMPDIAADVLECLVDKGVLDWERFEAPAVAVQTDLFTDREDK